VIVWAAQTEGAAKRIPSTIVHRKLTQLYSICRFKPMVSADASRKHFSDPSVPCGCSSVIAK
jgi:hypothetical protein